VSFQEFVRNVGSKCCRWRGDGRYRET